MSRPLVFFVSVFAAVVYLAQLSCSFMIRLCLLVFLTVLCAVFLYLKYSIKETRILVLAVIAGALWFSLYHAAVYKPILRYDGYYGEIKAEITARPEGKGMYSVSDAKLLFPKTGAIVPPKISLIIKDASSALSPGDIVTCIGRLALPKAQSGFDYAVYRRGTGVFLNAYQEEDYRVETPDSLPLRYFPSKIAEKINDSILRVGGKNAGFMKAMVTGDKSGIDRSLQASLSITGTSHIAVVSGMNIAFLVGFLFLVFGKRTGTWISFPMVLLFMAVVGFSPSVMRAGIMYLLTLIASVLRKEADGLTSLSVALFLILLSNPYAIRDIGLLLSFGATLGILLFSEPINNALLRTSSGVKSRLKRFFSPAALILSATVSASVFTLPLTACFFGRYSLISPIANLLVLPIFSITFSLILISAVLGLFAPATASLIIKLPSLLFDLAVLILSRLSRVPYASVSSGNIYFALLIALVYALLFICIRSHDKKRTGAACVVAVCLSFCVAVIFSTKQDKSTVKTAVISGAYGGSCTVVSCGGETVMVDCGSERFGQSAGVASDYLINNGLRSVDMLILTSNDAFHAGAASELLLTGVVEKVLLLTSDTGGAVEGAIDTAFSLGVPVYTVDRKTCVERRKIRFYLIPSKDANLVKIETENGTILIGTAKNGYLLARRLQTENMNCDILITEKETMEEKTAAGLIIGSCTPGTIVFTEGRYDLSGSEKIPGFDGSVLTTGTNGTVTISDIF